MKKHNVISIVLICCLLPVSLYSLQEAIKLLPPKLNSEKSLYAALFNRKSSRSFGVKELPPQVLSNLLWAAAGVNRPATGLRTAPTAVNWQEIDIYVALEQGLYLYNAKDHSLEGVLAEDIRDQVGLQAFTGTAPVGLIYVADYQKMGNATREQKDFYSATDTGFISQNVYLYCASEGLATVVLGMVDKPALAKKIGLKEHQMIILTQPVGYPKE